MSELLRTLIGFTRHQQKLERLTSIAITLPGIIDTENGVVHRMPYYEDVKEMPLGDSLERHTGVPVYIQHDISARTMAEALLALHAARATLSGGD